MLSAFCQKCFFFLFCRLNASSSCPSFAFAFPIRPPAQPIAARPRLSRLHGRAGLTPGRASTETGLILASLHGHTLLFLFVFPFSLSQIMCRILHQFFMLHVEFNGIWYSTRSASETTERRILTATCHIKDTMARRPTNSFSVLRARAQSISHHLLLPAQDSLRPVPTCQCMSQSLSECKAH